MLERRVARRYPFGTPILSVDNAVVIVTAVCSLKGDRQEVEFVPGPEEFRGRFDEVEYLMFSSENCVGLFLHIDRRALDQGGFPSEVMGTDESPTPA